MDFVGLNSLFFPYINIFYIFLRVKIKYLNSLCYTTTELKVGPSAFGTPQLHPPPPHQKEQKIDNMYSATTLRANLIHITKKILHEIY